jgi:hypothetical protein
MDGECACMVVVIAHEANMMTMIKMMMMIMMMTIQIIANHIKKEFEKQTSS